MADLSGGGRGRPDAIAVSEEINHVTGANLDVLASPGGAIRLLYLECERGDYRIRVGDIPLVDMGNATPPAGNVLDGTGTLGLTEGQVRVLAVPPELTVLGLKNNSVLTFYYV